MPRMRHAWEQVTAAADDKRVKGIVAAEVFSDLRTVARGRAPGFLTEGIIARAFGMAEARGAFRVDCRPCRLATASARLVESDSTTPASIRPARR